MIYMYVFFGSTFFAYLAYRSKDKALVIIFSAISILIPALLGGFRDEMIGIDSQVYGVRLSREALGSESFFDFFMKTKTEPGCKVLFYCGAKLLGNYTGAFILLQLVTMTFFYIGAYKLRKFAPSPITFFVFFITFYTFTLTGMRQSLALSVTFMGLDTLLNGKYFKFTLYTATAMLFHYSAVANIPFLLGMHMLSTSETYQKNNSTKLIIIGGMVISIMVLIPLMAMVASRVSFLMKYAGYLVDVNNSGRANVATDKSVAFDFLYVGEFIMLILFGRHASHILRGSHGENNASFCFLGTVFCLMFDIVVPFMHRAIMYWDVIHVMILAALPGFVKEKYLRLMVLLVVTALLLAYWWRGMLVHGYNSRLYPFKFVSR